jgi:hypothetical protein
MIDDRPGLREAAFCHNLFVCLVRNITVGTQLINQRELSIMDTADLREKAQTCRRWEEALPRNDPERFFLLELHDDLLAGTVRLERVTKPGARRKGIQRARRQRAQ